MLTSQKNLSWNSYTRWALNSIWTSQFLYGNTNRVLRLRRLNCSIQHRKKRKLHYFYLVLLTKKRTHAHKFYTTEKDKATLFFKPKLKKQLIRLKLKPKQQGAALREILTHIIAKQTHVEKAVWTYEQASIKMNIPFVPLTPNTLSLQAKNNYFPDFTLSLRFDLPSTTAFQKLFFLRLLRFVSPVVKVKKLDLLLSIHATHEYELE